jgi:cadmium resistance protein CadD (predicted permease)
LLPEAVISYFGLLPLLLGLRAGWQAWRERGQQPDGKKPTTPGPTGPVCCPLLQ